MKVTTKQEGCVIALWAFVVEFAPKHCGACLHVFSKSHILNSMFQLSSMKTWVASYLIWKPCWMFILLQQPNCEHSGFPFFFAEENHRHTAWSKDSDVSLRLDNLLYLVHFINQRSNHLKTNLMTYLKVLGVAQFPYRYHPLRLII